jgi:two-component system, cell cycle sensor histidine kinase and response regulator CckA
MNFQDQNESVSMGESENLRFQLSRLQDLEVENDRSRVKHKDSVNHESRLLQAKKTEAITTLAAGLTNDFNNILTPIIGYTQMALDEVLPTNSIKRKLEQILLAAQQAKELVEQIFTYSSVAQERRRIPVDVSLAIEEGIEFLRKSLPETIRIRKNIEKCFALADTWQMHRMLVNLCVNASEAMNYKGKIDVSLSKYSIIESDEILSYSTNLRCGQYIKLGVSDTGHGINKSVLERIFDPYFTTKDVGRGNGLGLAVVHGIVKRHEGAILVHSILGKGTTFDVYIPRIETGD